MDWQIAVRTGQYTYGTDGWTLVAGEDTDAPHLIAVFASPDLPETANALETLRDRCPCAHIIGTTTGGEVLGEDPLDGSIVACSIEFENGHVHTHFGPITEQGMSFTAGRNLAAALDAPDLQGILVLSDGLDTNGGMLIRGIRDALSKEVPVFGGLAADMMDFVVTRVSANGAMKSGSIAAVGFYGAAVSIKNVVAGGWQTMSESRLITSVSSSIIYEIAGQPALTVFRELAQIDTCTGITELVTRPLWIHEPGNPQNGDSRAIVGFDERRGSLMVAGEVRPNSACAVLSGDPVEMIDASRQASKLLGPVAQPNVALIVGCAGRKLALGNHVTRELSAIYEILQPTNQIGFHAYGQFGRRTQAAQNEFLNNHLSITTISETT